VKRLVAEFLAWLITAFTRLITGAQARWIGCGPNAVKRVYFGNHRSHADFVLIWAALPTLLRKATRPVAGSDYWEKGAIRSFLIHEVLNGVLVDRSRTDRTVDPIETMAVVLDAGQSLILFPEGTRNTSEEVLLPFKSGIYHLAKRCPDAQFVPVWMENQGRVLPKGEVIPVPLLCSVNFGEPLALGEGEEKAAFVDRARNALLALAASVKPN
jgi:hypothetical protein